MITQGQMLEGFSSELTKRELNNLFSKGFKVRMFSLEDQNGMLCIIDEQGKVYFDEFIEPTDKN